MLKHIDVHDEAYMICPHKPRLENIWQFCYMIGSSTDFRRYSLLVLWRSIGQSLWVKESFVSESDRQQKFAQIWNCLAFFGQFADIWHFVSLFMPKMVYKCHIFTKDIMWVWQLLRIVSISQIVWLLSYSEIFILECFGL